MSKLIKPIPSLQEQAQEQEKMRDVLLLLDNLFKRETATARLILGNLYDVGTINLVNQKIPLKVVSPLLKLIASSSKPLILILAVRIFQAYCPKLVANYLYSLVEFKKEPIAPVTIIDRQLSPPEVQAKLREVQTLRKQVRMLTGSLVAVIALFAGSSLFIVHRVGLKPSELLQPTQTVIEQSQP